MSSLLASPCNLTTAIWFPDTSLSLTPLLYIHPRHRRAVGPAFLGSYDDRPEPLWIIRGTRVPPPAPTGYPPGYGPPCGRGSSPRLDGRSHTAEHFAERHIQVA